MLIEFGSTTLSSPAIVATTLWICAFSPTTNVWLFSLKSFPVNLLPYTTPFLSASTANTVLLIAEAGVSRFFTVIIPVLETVKPPRFVT